MSCYCEIDSCHCSCSSASTHPKRCCFCKNKMVTGKFGLAYVIETPKHRCVKPLGWQVEFEDTPSTIDTTFEKIAKWVNCPPIDNRSLCRRVPLECAQYFDKCCNCGNCWSPPPQNCCRLQPNCYHLPNCCCSCKCLCSDTSCSCCSSGHIQEPADDDIIDKLRKNRNLKKIRNQNTRSTQSSDNDTSLDYIPDKDSGTEQTKDNYETTATGATTDVDDSVTINYKNSSFRDSDHQQHEDNGSDNPELFVTHTDSPIIIDKAISANSIVPREQAGVNNGFVRNSVEKFEGMSLLDKIRQARHKQLEVEHMNEHA